MDFSTHFGVSYKASWWFSNFFLFWPPQFVGFMIQFDLPPYLFQLDCLKPPTRENMFEIGTWIRWRPFKMTGLGQLLGWIFSGFFQLNAWIGLFFFSLSWRKAKWRLGNWVENTNQFMCSYIWYLICMVHTQGPFCDDLLKSKTWSEILGLASARCAVFWVFFFF